MAEGATTNAERANPKKEGVEMLIGLLLLAGLFMWATGHMVLR
ncbi:MAG TPA: hypothetical protein VKV57_09480 [bacterium]|nr:hypothetical protein [bacterium]